MLLLPCTNEVYAKVIFSHDFCPSTWSWGGGGNLVECSEITSETYSYTQPVLPTHLPGGVGGLEYPDISTPLRQRAVRNCFLNCLLVCPYLVVHFVPSICRKSMLAEVDQHLTEILPISYGGNDTSILVQFSVL